MNNSLGNFIRSSSFLPTEVMVLIQLVIHIILISQELEHLKIFNYMMVIFETYLPELFKQQMLQTL